MHTGYIHSIDTFGSVDGPGVRFVVFMQAVSCAAATATIRIHGYCQRDFPPGRSTRTSGASALSEGVSCPSKHTGSQEVIPEALLRQALRYRSYCARAAASPSAAENRSFKLTFCVNFSSLPKNSTFTPHWTPRDSHLPPPNLSFPA